MSVRHLFRAFTQQLAAAVLAGVALLPSVAQSQVMPPPYATPQGEWNSALAPPGYCSTCDAGGGCASCGENWAACGPCDPCGAFGRVEYLMWWSHDRRLPALATTSVNGTPQALAGRLDQLPTTVLIGDEDVGEDMRSGGRVTVGKYLGPGRELAVNGRFWGLEDSASTVTFASATGDPILARPFYNVVLAQSDALLLAFPGITNDGSINVQTHNDVMGADVYLRSMLIWDPVTRMDFLIGYQFTRMDDSVFIESNSTSVDVLSPTPVGTTFNILDSFRTQNEFHGGQIGFITEHQHGRFRFDVMGKIALGNMRQRAILAGQTTTTEPLAVPVVADTGFLVQGTNEGDRTRNVLAFIPEVSLGVGYNVTRNFTLNFGYSFMYWSDSILAGDQIDLQLNLSQNPGPIVGDPRPRFAFQNNDFWVMGMNFGAEYRF